MRINRLTIVLAIISGVIIGSGVNGYLTTRATHAQGQMIEDDGSAKVIVYGYGVASSSTPPPGEQFTIMYAPQYSLKIVPPGKQLIVTDLMFQDKGSVKQNLTVNIASANPATEKANILLQVPLRPGEPKEIHFCTGYLIQSGHALAAWTNAGVEAEQYVNISITGYLVDEQKK